MILRKCHTRWLPGQLPRLSQLGLSRWIESTNSEGPATSVSQEGIVPRCNSCGIQFTRRYTSLLAPTGAPATRESSLDGAPVSHVDIFRTTSVGFHSRRQFFSFADGTKPPARRRHEEERLLRYSPEQLFDVVADVDNYREFIPWCQSSRVLRKHGDSRMEAELQVGFNVLTEKYISHVQLDRPRIVRSSVSNSLLFHHLDSSWEFVPGKTPHTCKVHFVVDFQFKSPMYQQIADLFFNEVVMHIMGSFEKRCARVYGAPKRRRVTV